MKSTYILYLKIFINKNADALKNYTEMNKNTEKWKKIHGNTEEYLNLQLCEGGVEDEELLLVESHTAAHLPPQQSSFTFSFLFWSHIFKPWLVLQAWLGHIGQNLRIQFEADWEEIKKKTQ